jgi:hypothetical protein
MYSLIFCLSILIMKHVSKVVIATTHVALCINIILCVMCCEVSYPGNPGNVKSEFFEFLTNFQRFSAGKIIGMNRHREGTARRGRNRRQAHSRNFTCRVLLSKLSDETVQEINNRKYCQLCHRSPSDPLLYGKLYSIGQVTVHYYCLVIPSELNHLQTFHC